MIKKSAVIAFWELLDAVENEEEVFLLRSSDVFSNIAIQEYNDNLYSEEVADSHDPALQEFVNGLSEQFDAAGSLIKRTVPPLDEDMMKKISKAILQLSDRRENIIL